MIDITAYARRIRTRTTLAAVLFFGGATLMALDFTSKYPTAEKGAFAALWAGIMAVGGLYYFLSMELPQKELLALAESHGGLLTLSEISTALAINPALALRTLRHLQQLGLASPKWQELQKNLWEFPDYLKLPVAESIALAKKNGGRLALADLLAGGYSAEIAEQTLDTLSAKGLAQNDPAAQGRSLLIHPA